jgi:hypothetical protein
MRCLRAIARLAVFLPLHLLILASLKLFEAATEDLHKVNTRAFAVLFLRVDTFEKWLEAADLAQQPKPHLRRNLALHPRRLSLISVTRFKTLFSAQSPYKEILSCVLRRDPITPVRF